MNKKELIRQLVDETGFKERQVRTVVECLLRKTIDVLVNDQALVLQTFGTFRTVWQAERPGRNPKTGEPKVVPSRRTVKFKPGKAFLWELNNNEKE